jgi:5'-nucleotidase
MKLFHFLAFLLAISVSTASFAKVIQILHTNDLHSFFQGTRGGIGGYAQLKKVVDELKNEAASKGIPTLFLDGGDFGEGSSFYFSNHGVDSLRALDMLGVDVAVLGNHDFILGGRELRHQIRQAGLKTKILSANLKGKRWMGLRKLIPDYVDYEFEGLKLRIFGLTTNEIHYMYPLRPLGFIRNPHKSGIKQARRARKNRVDFTVALTHIGLANDIRLVEKSRSIDMVVGGHSHTRLSKPQLTKNLEGRLIPIVQAGAHGGNIGSMILDIQGNGQAQLIDYRMVGIKKDMPQDEDMKKFVSVAYDNREQYFGRSWEEVIGFSEIRLSGSYNGHQNENNSCWSRHIARLTRKVANTELGLQFDAFQGEQIDPGVITFGDMVDNFPHFRKWGDKGWKISRARVSGFLLKRILRFMANSPLGLQVTIDGVQVKNKNGEGASSFDPKVHRVEEAMVDGEQLNSLRFYTIGLPSEVPYGVLKLANVFAFIILQELSTVPDGDYWFHLEKYIRDNSPLQCLVD